MKYASLFLLTIVFLTSCAPPATLAPTQTSTPEPTATQTPTQTPSPTSTITPTPTQIGGGSGSLIFEYYKAAYEKSFPNLKGSENVFMANWDGTNLMPVTNGLEGFDHIESISKDGQMALISLSDNNYSSTNSDLYLVHLNQQASNPIKLASGLDYPSGSSQAIFLDNSQVVYIGLGPEGRGFYTVNIDGTNKNENRRACRRKWAVGTLSVRRNTCLLVRYTTREFRRQYRSGISNQEVTRPYGG